MGKIILADKSIHYLADLIKENVLKEVVFSAEGNIICESK